MAGVKQIDLEVLSNDEIHYFYKTEDLNILPEKVINYVLAENELSKTAHGDLEWFLRYNRKSRIKNILNQIVLERFKAQEIK